MRKLTQQDFLDRAHAVHGDTYDYSNAEYVDMSTSVEIICKKHGPFMQAPGNHLRGAGCSLCTKGENRRVSKDDFLSRARAAHGDKYDYSNVIMKTGRDKVTIVCPVHGMFEQTPSKHMSGQGCPKCAKNHKDDRESFIEKARAKHGDFYDYSKVEYVDEHTKVCIIDRDYGEFWQQPNAHTQGQGHPYRKLEKAWFTNYKSGKISQSEVQMYDALVLRFGEDDVFPNYWSEAYPFACDFYVKSLNLYIELNACQQHGRHWFDPSSPKDLATLAKWHEKALVKSWYKKCITVWTISDVKKLAVARANRLNYLVFWKSDLTDFKEWLALFDKDPSNPVLCNV